MLDLQEYLVTEFIEDYEDGILSRADLEKRVVGILGATEAHEVLRDLRVPVVRSQAMSDTPSGPKRDTKGLHVQDVRIPIKGGEMQAYLARPEGDGRYPGIVAIHENRGLVEHTRDCARRLASEGYVVVAPDLLSRQGGTAQFSDPADATAGLGKSDPEENAEDLVAVLDWLRQQPSCNGRLGVTGWCMGGGYTWRVATKAGNRIVAAVPWYGPNPPSGVENIAAPVFAIYGGLDERINAGIDAITEQMKQNGKSFDKKIYPNAQHAFNNDTNPERYNAEQAPIAWADMLAFFQRHLKAS